MDYTLTKLLFLKSNGLHFNNVNFFNRVRDYTKTTLLFKVTMPNSGCGQGYIKKKKID